MLFLGWFGGSNLGCVSYLEKMERVLKILVRFQKKEEWSNDKEDYDEEVICQFEEIENLMDPSGYTTVKKVQVYRTHTGSYYYILVDTASPQNPGESEKWLFHSTCEDTFKKSLIIEKCKNFDPVTLDHLLSLDTNCNETIKAYLWTLNLCTSKADDSESFSRELINCISGEIKWKNPCASKRADQDTDSDADKVNAPIRKSGSCSNTPSSNTSSQRTPQEKATLTVTRRAKSCRCKFHNHSFWEGKFLFREGDTIDLFEGNIDEKTKFLSIFEAEKILVSESRIMSICLSGVYIRQFSAGTITKQSTLSSYLVMLKIQSSGAESLNLEGTWWTLFLNSHPVNRKNVLVNWYVLIHKHNVVDPGKAQSNSQIVKINLLKKDDCLYTVGQFWAFLQESYIPIYQRNHRPGDTYSFSEEIFRRLSKSRSHVPFLLRHGLGVEDDTPWPGKLVFFSEGATREYTVENISTICQDLDPHRLVKVTQVAIYKNPLNGRFEIPDKVFHSYVVFHTSDDQYWSIEKVPTDLRLQRSRIEEDVRDKSLGKPRFCEAQTPKCVISDISNCLLFGVLQFIEQSGELRSPYVFTTDNCMRFAKLMFDHMASGKEWKIPKIVQVANRLTNQFYGDRNFRERMYTY
jgi:hypothetical protein